MNPAHGQVPVFLNLHVLVKVFPAGTLELSGMVTSSSSTAPFLHSTPCITLASFVSVGKGVTVGRGVTIFVGDRVDVTKEGTDGVSGWIETVMQEVIRNKRSKEKHIVFVMVDFDAMRVQKVSAFKAKASFWQASKPATKDRAAVWLPLVATPRSVYRWAGFSR